MIPTLAAVLATTMRLVVSHGYAEGAPPGFSGGFKEDSCHACHFDAELNSGGGRVTIEGVPSRFAAGERYTLTVTLGRVGMKRAGFQLAGNRRFKLQGHFRSCLVAHCENQFLRALFDDIPNQLNRDLGILHAAVEVGLTTLALQLIAYTNPESELRV